MTKQPSRPSTSVGNKPTDLKVVTMEQKMAIYNKYSSFNSWEKKKGKVNSKEKDKKVSEF
jgi:hypothetical protein